MYSESDKMRATRNRMSARHDSCRIKKEASNKHGSIFYWQKFTEWLEADGAYLEKGSSVD